RPRRPSRFPTRRSSDLRPADLAGRTVAVNALNNIGGLLISGALRKLGVDTTAIKFMEIGFPDANAALESGRVDAAYQTEPFLHQDRKSTRLNSSHVKIS